MKKMIATLALTLGLVFGAVGTAQAIPGDYNGDPRSRVVEVTGYQGANAVCTVVSTDTQRGRKFEKYTDRETGETKRGYVTYRVTHQVVNCVNPYAN